MNVKIMESFWSADIFILSNATNGATRYWFKSAFEIY